MIVCPTTICSDTAIVSCELPPVDESFAQLEGIVDKLHIEPDLRRMVLQFDGGVTEEWLSNRIANWTGMIVEHQAEVRKARKTIRGKSPTAGLRSPAYRV